MKVSTVRREVGVVRRHRDCLLAEACVSGSGYGFGATGDVEFDEDVGDVVADCLVADHQVAGDRGVCQAIPFGALATIALVLATRRPA